jgi:hypothetical protein
VRKVHAEMKEWKYLVPLLWVLATNMIRKILTWNMDEWHDGMSHYRNLNVTVASVGEWPT